MKSDEGGEAEMLIDDSEYVVLDVDVVELDRLAAIYTGGDRDAFLREAIRVMAARDRAERRQTPITTGTTAPASSAVASPASEPEPEPAAATSAAPKAPAVIIPENAKTSINMDLLTRLKLRADTAVLRTAGLRGGYRSRGQLINAAIEAELIRLEAEFNDGEEFPPNMGSFRTGRPLGS